MDDNKAIRRRNLRALIEEAGSQAEVARRLGGDENQASYIAQIVGERARRQVGDKLARELEQAFGKLRGWMDKDHSDSHNTSQTDESRDYVKRVPLLTWAEAGSAGNMGVMERSPGEFESRIVITAASVSDEAFALRVRGDSMVNPSGPHSYPDGCVIIIDPARKAKAGDRVIVRMPDADVSTFKQLEQDGSEYLLKPLNPRYPIVAMPRGAKIIGVVVQTQIDE